MLTLLHGAHDDRLITPCEQLCHAHLMLGRWAQARAALGRAHALAAARYGADSPTALRLAQVRSAPLDACKRRVLRVAAGGDKLACGVSGEVAFGLSPWLTSPNSNVEDSPPPRLYLLV
jgi:hypothetical protein